MSVAGLWLACGCSPASVNCTDVGGVPGIQVGFDSVVTKHAGEHLRARACVGDHCEGAEVRGREPQRSMIIGRTALHDTNPVQVTLTITDARGQVVFAGEATVTPRRVDPNGPHCEPHVLMGAVTAEGKHRLVDHSSDFDDL